MQKEAEDTINNEEPNNAVKEIDPNDPIYGQRIEQALNLYYSARELKAAALRHFYPEMTEEEVQQKVKEIFFYAVT